MLLEKGDPSAVVWTVGRWCLDSAAGLEGSSTGEVQQMQKICRRYCWVIAAPRKSERPNALVLWLPCMMQQVSWVQHVVIILEIFFEILNAKSCILAPCRLRK